MFDVCWRNASCILGALVILNADAAVAFEADGFQTGMTEAVALQVLGQPNDYALVKDSSNTRNFTSYATNPPAPFRVLSFCDGKLVSYQRALVGDWHTFMRIVDRQSHDKGAGKYLLYMGETSYGQQSGLTFRWNLGGGDTYEISHSALGQAAEENQEYFLSANRCIKSN